MFHTVWGNESLGQRRQVHIKPSMPGRERAVSNSAVTLRPPRYHETATRCGRGAVQLTTLDPLPRGVEVRIESVEQHEQIGQLVGPGRRQVGVLGRVRTQVEEARHWPAHLCPLRPSSRPAAIGWRRIESRIGRELATP